jgi:hypothetical protein
MAVLSTLATSVHAQERAIIKEIVVPAGQQQVWEAWTTQQGIESFFAPEAVIDARPGGAFHIHINPYADKGMKGLMTCASWRCKCCECSALISVKNCTFVLDS